MPSLAHRINPSDLPPKVKSIVEYYFQNPSKTQQEIASNFGLSQSRISLIFNNHKVQSCYRFLARKRINEIIPKAVGAIEHCVTQDKNDKIRFMAAKSVLLSEKVLEPPAQVQITNNVQSITTVLDLSSS